MLVLVLLFFFDVQGKLFQNLFGKVVFGAGFLGINVCCSFSSFYLLKKHESCLPFYIIFTCFFCLTFVTSFFQPKMDGKTCFCFGHLKQIFGR